LRHAKKRDHVLYFDDLIGLFLAGITSNSTLSAAVVLKPYLERRDVRVLGEVTPEGLRVLQERDRGFADLFHLIPVREPTDADTAARSGLSLAFLDPKQRLDRDDVRDRLRELVIGQSDAVEALADVVSVAKARLNDPDRPLAAFLFLGPTGVGKTECAKAITR